jgi:hypothetical protein
MELRDRDGKIPPDYANEQMLQLLASYKRGK